MNGDEASPTPRAPLFLCVGDIDVDVLVEVDRLPTRDGKVNGSFLRRVPGGMAGNVSVALARLGAPVRVLGLVGDDEDAAFALECLNRAGIDTGFVRRLLGAKTFSCICLITPDGEKSLVKVVTEAYRPSAHDLVDAAWHGVAHIHLTSVGDAALCRRVVQAARQAGATASLDVERADCPRDAVELAAAVAGFDLLFCNAEARGAVDALLAVPLGSLVPAVVTTLGADGARVETGKVAHHAPGVSVAVRDTTGAGDCFAAACLHARVVRRLDWGAALSFANHAAALSTTAYGAQSALPTLEEVEAVQRKLTYGSGPS